jgi:hypothetical protein
MEDGLSRQGAELRSALHSGVAALEDKLAGQLSQIQAQLASDEASRARVQDQFQSQTAAKLTALESFFAEAIETTNANARTFQDRTQAGLKSLGDFAESLQANTTHLATTTQESLTALRGEAKASLDYLNTETLKRFDRVTSDLAALTRDSQANSQRMGEIIKDEITARFSSDMCDKKRAEEPDLGRFQIF